MKPTRQSLGGSNFHETQQTKALDQYQYMFISIYRKQNKYEIPNGVSKIKKIIIIKKKTQ